MLLRRCILACLLASPAGFSTAETTAVIAATSILSATATPQIQEYLENAREIKALGDVKVISLSIVRLAFNVHRVGAHQRVRPTLLVSEGETPDADGPESRPWTASVDQAATQSLEAHLVDNRAGYPVASGAFARWRGPYLERLSADPWGSRYAVNVGFLEGTQGHAVIVVSAGPNRIIETPFETVGLRDTGDDVIGLVGSGRR